VSSKERVTLWHKHVVDWWYHMNMDSVVGLPVTCTRSHLISVYYVLWTILVRSFTKMLLRRQKILCGHILLVGTCYHMLSWRMLCLLAMVSWWEHWYPTHKVIITLNLHSDSWQIPFINTLFAQELSSTSYKEPINCWMRELLASTTPPHFSSCHMINYPSSG